jgi:glycosyltransferase involved in cell wall biosynthesis
MTPARILHVADFAAPYPGAFIRQLRMLNEELVERGAAPLAFAFPQRAEGREWLEQLHADGHDVELLPEPRSRGGAALAGAVAEVVVRAQADVVHTHFGGYDMAAASAVRTLRRGGRTSEGGVVLPRLVWHYRTALETSVAKRSPARRAKDWLKFVRAGRSVDWAVAVTAATAEEVAERGMGERARAVIAGCDTDVFCADTAVRARVRQQLGIADDEILVLHMGWNWHRKGGDLLAEAARMLHKRGQGNLVFCSIGAPPERVEEPVRRLEPTDSVWELHQASDIFVSASRSEAFGNGLVEAMSCERVAIGALVEGQREIFEHLRGCLSVTPGDARSLADGLERLVASREAWATHGASNRARVLERYSMRRWARDMADVYAELGVGVPSHEQEQSARDENEEVRSA